MLKKIETKKSNFLTKGEQLHIFGGEKCTIDCNCGTQCGDNLAHRNSKDNSGVAE